MDFLAVFAVDFLAVDAVAGVLLGSVPRELVFSPAWAGALSQKGFYSPDGGYTTISLIVFLAWTLVTSGWLAFRMGTERGDTTAYSTGDQA